MESAKGNINQMSKITGLFYINLAGYMYIEKQFTKRVGCSLTVHQSRGNDTRDILSVYVNLHSDKSKTSIWNLIPQEDGSLLIQLYGNKDGRNTAINSFFGAYISTPNDKRNDDSYYTCVHSDGSKACYWEIEEEENESFSFKIKRFGDGRKDLVGSYLTILTDGKKDIRDGASEYVSVHKNGEYAARFVLSSADVKLNYQYPQLKNDIVYIDLAGFPYEDKIFSKRIGSSLTVHQYRGGDKRDDLSIYVNLHSDKSKPSKWNLLQQDDGVYLIQLNGNKDGRKTAINSFLGAYTTRPQDKRDNYSHYVCVHSDRSKVCFWEMEQAGDEKFFFKLSRIQDGRKDLIDRYLTIHTDKGKDRRDELSDYVSVHENKFYAAQFKLRV